MNTMATQPKSLEDVESSLQYMVINHLKRLYVKQSPYCGLIADGDLKSTLELVCDHLPAVLQTRIQEVFELHSLLNASPIERYYVQCLSATHFVVRERQAENIEPLPSDPVVRDTFSTRPDANCYARAMNELQRSLDLEYGRWTKHGAGKTTKEETTDGSEN